MRGSRTNNGVVSGEAGFSLIEMIIVVAILLILAGMALPNFMQMVARARLQSSAHQITGLTIHARMLGSANFSRTMVSYDTTSSLFKTYIRGYGVTAWSESVPNMRLGLPTGVTIAVPSGAYAPSGTGNGTTAAVLCYTEVFNSRGYPIYDSTAVSAGYNLCTTAATTQSDGVMRVSDQNVFYLKNSTGYMAVSVGNSGKTTTYMWSPSNSSWVLFGK